MIKKNKKTVLILGATGMLGSAVYDVLKDKYNLILTVRSLKKINLLSKTYGSPQNHKVVEFDVNLLYQDYLTGKGWLSNYLNNFLKQVNSSDYIINAIGVTIPYALENPALTFFINASFPHILAKIFGHKFIHITTDCVYNGIDGFPYTENSLKTPVDLYALSKSLGEPSECLTLRTSIIGRELEGFTGLLEWFLHQKGKTISGYVYHFWNGITTREFGKVCDKIISNRNQFPKTGIYHIFSETISKYEMLKKFREKFNIDCKIVKEKTKRLNRTLSTIYDFNSQLKMPSFDEMLKEL